MGLTLTVAEFASKAIRSSVGNGGVRKFVPSGHGSVTNQQGGIIGSIVNAALKFAGWVLGGLWNMITGFISWSFSGLWGLFVQAVSFIWHFNWNVTDEQLDQSLQSAFDAFGGVLGGAVGKAAASLVVLGGGAVLFCFNEALAMHVLKEVGEEALEEMAESVTPVVRGAAGLLGRWAFNNSYKAIRNALGLNPDAAYLTDAQLAEKVQRGEITQEEADKNKKGRDALKAQRKPWSFANQVEEWVESLPDGFVENFVEEALEEFFEGITELGYVAFSSIDSFIANQKRGHQVATGTSTGLAVQVQLHRSTNGTP